MYPLGRDRYHFYLLWTLYLSLRLPQVITRREKCSNYPSTFSEHPRESVSLGLGRGEQSQVITPNVILIHPGYPLEW